jgi:hypothetical protein
VELAVAAGPAVAMLALIGSGRTLKEGFRSPLALSVLLVWGLLWVSGKNMGEAARLWIFLTPWLLVVAAHGLRAVPASADEIDTATMNRRWLILIALQAVLCLLTAHRVDGFHFEELLERAEETRQPTLDDSGMRIAARAVMTQGFPTTRIFQSHDAACVRA